MIEKIHEDFYLYCDLCDSEEGPFTYFDEAVDYKKENGWKSTKDKLGGWQDICPECQKGGKR